MTRIAAAIFAVALAAPALFAAAPARADDVLYLPAPDTPHTSVPDDAGDGSYDLPTLVRWRALISRRGIVVPRELLARRVTVKLADARGYDRIRRVEDALRDAGFFWHGGAVTLLQSEGVPELAFDDNAVLLPPPPGCSPDSPPRWHLEGRVSVRAIGAALAAYECRTVGMSRALAARTIIFGIDSESHGRRNILGRVQDALRAHEIYEYSFCDRLDTVAPPPPPPPAPAPPVMAKDIDMSESELDDGLQCTAGRCRIKQRLRNRLLEDDRLHAILFHARIVPAFENGKAIGLKLFAIRPGSVWQRLGLMNGDTLLDLDGFALQSVVLPDGWPKLVAKLRGAKELTLSLKRRGQPMTLTYVVQD